jgi:hypothetical protein
MTRLAISVEGATEREFVSRVLAPDLAHHGVYASPVDMRGNISIDRIRNELNRLLKTFDHVTTFYDFYGFHKRPSNTVEGLESAIVESVDPDFHRKLVPYVQRYEFEALVLAASFEAEQVLGVRGLANRLQRIVDECGGAEHVNDSYETCPSRRIKAEVSAYDKKVSWTTDSGALS